MIRLPPLGGERRHRHSEREQRRWVSGCGCLCFVVCLPIHRSIPAITRLYCLEARTPWVPSLVPQHQRPMFPKLTSFSHLYRYTHGYSASPLLASMSRSSHAIFTSNARYAAARRPHAKYKQNTTLELQFQEPPLPSPRVPQQFLVLAPPRSRAPPLAGTISTTRAVTHCTIHHR